MQTGVLAVLAALSVAGVGAFGVSGMMSGAAPGGMNGGMMGGGMGGMHGGMQGDCHMDQTQMQNHTMDCDTQMDMTQCPCCGDGDGQ